tara:strand:- start:243 stop:449 length:207 start_codon:yes stop_codon:yes gene_type:complete
VSSPRDVIARSEGRFENISVRWMAGNATKLYARNTEGISRSEKRAHVISTANVLQYKNYRKVIFVKVF